ncbi:hypothetical protein [Cellulosimicrobium cellulans]|uniref:Uncharacterized protein n=1 Tax=Cellulosimicrobium cellulans TaxID=1710 RepID=A0A4Y4DZR2_CELCE|nr:hypothetical protein [Cellulosimicrobium cellulans]GED08828.1 hypothetical protein CCE02nite_08270 [Cellulosimicrobium cellulans]
MPRRRTHIARDLTLVLLALGGPALVLRQRHGRGWVVDDVVTAVTVSGLVCLVAAVGLALTRRAPGPVARERALYVVVGAFTAVGAGVATWRVLDEQALAAAWFGLLAAYAAGALHVGLAVTARRRPPR